LLANENRSVIYHQLSDGYLSGDVGHLGIGL
jgi:hypothetical protein